MLFKSLCWTLNILISYDSKSWTVRTDGRRLTSAEMPFIRRAVGSTLEDHKTTELIDAEKIRKKNSDSKDIKISVKRKEEIGKTTEIIKGFWFAISMTGLNRHNPGNDRDDDDDEECCSSLDINYTVSDQTWPTG